MVNQIKKFDKAKISRINKNKKNSTFCEASKKFLIESIKPKYTYNFSWLGVPIIQIPQDIHQLQEIIWEVKPNLIIETGIAHGGSLVFSASMLAILNMKKKEKRKVIGVDIDLRKHNKAILNKHFTKQYISFIDGSSTDIKVFNKIKKITKNYKKTLVILDSNHTHEHVLKELNLYSQLVSKNSYCIVFDTIINEVPNNYYPNRSWNKSNNPMTAVKEFLKSNKNFEIDKTINDKLMISMAKNGFLIKK
ncbi:MAG: cephalosporin hydroxylase [Candidatus Endolissoclinum sp. TMED37]|nr:MAG: cephalosporin hydroxylase [Candidatus Endolissoclinum sp. TMED37]|tara:strand:- start:3024 stop:3770 length:747 start_codon:yes stop_codon:yes gene_type:complete